MHDDAMLLCCGLTTLDVVQVVERVPGADEKVSAVGGHVAFGGPAANAAATAVALGVPTTLLTALGDGPVAAAARAGLRSRGVHVVDLLDGLPGAGAWQLPVSTVLVTASSGARAVASTNGAGLDGALLAGAARAAADGLLDGATCLLVDGHHLPAAVVVARAARARGVPVLLDGGSWKPGLGELLGLVDHAVLSADLVVPGEPAAGADAVLDAVAALGTGSVARSAGPGPVRVRLVAPGGGALRLDVTPPRVPADEVVDTLGAGDVLHGAAGAALARGEDVVAALRSAVRTAARSVRHPGALGWADAPG